MSVGSCSWSTCNASYRFAPTSAPKAPLRAHCTRRRTVGETPERRNARTVSCGGGDGSGDGSEDAHHEGRRANSDARDGYLRSKRAVAASTFAITFRPIFLFPAERVDVVLGVLRKTLPKDMVRWNARAELRGAILRDDDDKKCSTVTRPNGEQTTAVTMATSPTSSDVGNLRCSRMSALGSEGVWCQRLRSQ